LGIKAKTNSPLDVPKMPPKTSPLGLPVGTKSPLGGPLGGNTQKSPISTPPMPSLNPVTKEAPKKTGKKNLFDDDD
jgi:hypothetical protein